MVLVTALNPVLFYLELFLLLLGFITWLVWHFLSPRLAALMIHGRGVQSKLQKEGHSFFLSPSSAQLEQFKPINIVKRSFYPLIFLFGTTTIFIPILQHFGYIPATLNPISLAIYVLALGIVLWPTVSLFVIPIKWTIDSLGVRHFEHEKAIVRALELNPYLSDFISFSVAYQFLLTMFAAGELITALAGLLILLWLMYPPALLMTMLYMRFSIKKHARALEMSFEKKGYNLGPKDVRLVGQESEM